MKRYRYAFGCGMLVLCIVAVTGNSLAAPICVQAGVKFVLNVGSAGDAFVVHGFRSDPGFSVPKTGFAGSALFNTDKSIVVNWTENYAWGTGAWICPLGDTVLTISPTGVMAFDTTYVGASGCPNNTKGSASIIPCTGLLSPSSDEVAGPVPNAR